MKAQGKPEWDRWYTKKEIRECPGVWATREGSDNSESEDTDSDGEVLCEKLAENSKIPKYMTNDSLGYNICPIKLKT